MQEKVSLDFDKLNKELAALGMKFEGEDGECLKCFMENPAHSEAQKAIKMQLSYFEASEAEIMALEMKLESEKALNVKEKEKKIEASNTLAEEVGELALKEEGYEMPEEIKLSMKNIYLEDPALSSLENVIDQIKALKNAGVEKGKEFQEAFLSALREVAKEMGGKTDMATSILLNRLQIKLEN